MPSFDELLNGNVPNEHIIRKLVPSIIIQSNSNKIDNISMFLHSFDSYIVSDFRSYGPFVSNMRRPYVNGEFENLMDDMIEGYKKGNKKLYLVLIELIKRFS